MQDTISLYEPLIWSVQFLLESALNELHICLTLVTLIDAIATAEEVCTWLRGTIRICAEKAEDRAH